MTTSVATPEFAAAVADRAEARVQYTKPVGHFDSETRWMNVRLLRFEENGSPAVGVIDLDEDGYKRLRLDRIEEVEIGAAPVASEDTLADELSTLSGGPVQITYQPGIVIVRWRVQDSGASLVAPGDTLTAALDAALELERSL